jgi:hypothetical protein
MEEKEFNNIYAIPANYTDSGKLLGGMLEIRNTVEAGLLVFLLGYPELMWFQAETAIKVVVMVVTLLPLVILALMGINGDSLGRHLYHMFRHWRGGRKIHMRRIECKYNEAKEENKQ